MENKFRDATEAFYESLGFIKRFGQPVTVRGMETLELLNVTNVIQFPEKRCIFVDGRNDNIFAKCAETLWMLAGKDDVEWLSLYLPRALQFSDDGHTWRGAYGPRLRRWLNVDQLQYVYELLKSDPTSRQAVISIWDPVTDTKAGKDIPCNNWIQFIIRDGMLHMVATQRSSDIMWGYSGIDTFAWGVTHQILAAMLEIPMGEFTHHITSFHLYERHYDLASKILSTWFSPYPYDMATDVSGLHSVPCIIGSIRHLNDSLEFILRQEREVRKSGLLQRSWEELKNWFGPNDLLRVTGSAMLLWCALHTDNGREHDQYMESGIVEECINDLPECDIRLSMIEYLSRKEPAFLDSVDLSNAMYEWMYNHNDELQKR